MKIKADTGEIWRFYIFLQYFRDNLREEFQEKDKGIKYVLRALQESRIPERKARDLESDIFKEKKSLGQDLEKMENAVSRALGRLRRILNYLESLQMEEEYQAYKKAMDSPDRCGFAIIRFRGNDCYIRQGDIDYDRLDGDGMTNLERMENGFAPVGKDGLYVNLHHMIQKETGGIMEIQDSIHKGNHGLLHINPSSIPSGIQRNAFSSFKSDYWKRRAAFELRRRKDED